MTWKQQHGSRTNKTSAGVRLVASAVSRPRLSAGRQHACCESRSFFVFNFLSSLSPANSFRATSPQLNWGRHFGRLLWLEVPDEAREVLARNEALPKYDQALAFVFVVEKLKNVSKAEEIAPETEDWRVRKLKRVQ